MRGMTKSRIPGTFRRAFARRCSLLLAARSPSLPASRPPRAAAPRCCSPPAPISRASTRCSRSTRSPGRCSATCCSPRSRATTACWRRGRIWPGRGSGRRTDRDAHLPAAHAASAGTTAGRPPRGTSPGPSTPRAIRPPAIPGSPSSPSSSRSRAPDDSTLVLRFAAPQQRFPDVLTDLAILPAHLLDTVPRGGLRRAAWNAAPVGNGPFRFVAHEPNRRWVFAANSAFPAALGGPPRLDRFIVVVVDEPTTKLAALTSGELDFAGIQPAHADFVRARSRARGADLSAALHLRHRAQHPAAAVRPARASAARSPRRSTGGRSSTAISTASARRPTVRCRRTCRAIFRWRRRRRRPDRRPPARRSPRSSC